MSKEISYIVWEEEEILVMGKNNIRWSILINCKVWLYDSKGDIIISYKYLLSIT